MFIYPIGNRHKVKYIQKFIIEKRKIDFKTIVNI